MISTQEKTSSGLSVNRPFNSYIGSGQQILLLLVAFLCVRLPFLFVTNNSNAGDAWDRYQIALDWSTHPTQLPSPVWLPMHFWIMGLALKLSRSELAVRLISVFFGSLTILPFWKLVKGLFDVRVATYSALSFAVLGIHVGYSVVSSSEVLTVCFLVFGIYAWFQYRLSDSQCWATLSGLALSAACLCRYEPWLAVITLNVLNVTDINGIRLRQRRWRPLLTFLFWSSAGAMAWCAFSYYKWHDPFFSAHQTISLNGADPNKGQLLYRLAVVPGAIVASMGPLALLSALGIASSITRPRSPKWELSIVVTILLLTHYANSVLHSVTQARYILIYVWLLIPFAYEGMQTWMERHLPRWSRHALIAILLSFFMWQIGITVVARFGPCVLGDRLGQVSPTLPFRCGLRGLISWMDDHPTSGQSIILDNFSAEAREVVRFAHLMPGAVFTVSKLSGPADLQSMSRFVEDQHPRLLIYAPCGNLGRIESLPDAKDVAIQTSRVTLRLHRLWSAGDADYRIYEVEPIHRNEKEVN